MYLFTPRLYFPRWISLLLIVGTGNICLPTGAMDPQNPLKPPLWVGKLIWGVVAADQTSVWVGQYMSISGRKTLLTRPIRLDIGAIPVNPVVPNIRFPSVVWGLLAYLSFTLPASKLNVPISNIGLFAGALFVAAPINRMIDWIFRDPNKMIYYLCVNNRYVLNIADISFCLGYCMMWVHLTVGLTTRFIK